MEVSMITPEMIERVKDILVAEYKPVEPYLFGSYAWGHPDEYSDLDLLVVVDEYTEHPHHMLVNGHKALLGLRISKDIILFTKEVFERKAEHPSTLCHRVKMKGIKIYARAERVAYIC